MAKNLKTRLYEGKFRLFEVNLSIKSKKGSNTITKTVAGTEKDVEDYIRNYLKPSYRERGRKLETRYFRKSQHSGPIDIIAVSTNHQAT